MFTKLMTYEQNVPDYNARYIQMTGDGNLILVYHFDDIIDMAEDELKPYYAMEMSPWQSDNKIENITRSKVCRSRWGKMENGKIATFIEEINNEYFKGVKVGLLDKASEGVGRKQDIVTIVWFGGRWLTPTLISQHLKFNNIN